MGRDFSSDVADFPNFISKKNMDNTNDLGHLTHLAQEMGRAEKCGNAGTLRQLLHKDLRFRRADGPVVDRDAFLADLGSKTFETLRAKITQITAFFANAARPKSPSHPTRRPTGGNAPFGSTPASATSPRKPHLQLS